VHLRLRRFNRHVGQTRCRQASEPRNRYNRYFDPNTLRATLTADGGDGSSPAGP
jgi:hypothetical protein